MKKLFIFLVAVVLIVLVVVFYFLYSSKDQNNQEQAVNSQASGYLEKIDSSNRDEFRELYNGEFENEALALDEKEIFGE